MSLASSGRRSPSPGIPLEAEAPGLKSDALVGLLTLLLLLLSLAFIPMLSDAGYSAGNRFPDTWSAFGPVGKLLGSCAFGPEGMFVF